MKLHLETIRENIKHQVFLLRGRGLETFYEKTKCHSSKFWSKFSVKTNSRAKEET